MANVGRVFVENPDEILNAGHSGAGAVIQVQRDTAEAFTTPVDVTTVPIVTAVRSYTFYDSAGTSSSWYRFRYETSAGVGTSDWSTPFQVGDEQAGLLCSLYDVKQRIGLSASNTEDDETILEFIRDVSVDIMGYTGRQFAPDPSSGTKTYRLHTRAGYTLWVPKGIRSITTLGIATSDQPATGGTYTTAIASDYFLDPPEYERSYGWPATRIVFRSAAGTRFYNASYGAEITGAFGWATAPADIQGIAASAVIRRFAGKETATLAIALGPEAGIRLLRDITPAQQAKLDWYRQLLAA